MRGESIVHTVTVCKVLGAGLGGLEWGREGVYCTWSFKYMHGFLIPPHKLSQRFNWMLQLSSGQKWGAGREANPWPPMMCLLSSAWLSITHFCPDENWSFQSKRQQKFPHLFWHQRTFHLLQEPRLFPRAFLTWPEGSGSRLITVQVSVDGVLYLENVSISSRNCWCSVSRHFNRSSSYLQSLDQLICTQLGCDLLERQPWACARHRKLPLYRTKFFT